MGRGRWLGAIFRPAPIALASTVLGLVAVALPERVYRAWLLEPKYADWRVAAFLALAFVAFWFGTRRARPSLRGLETSRLLSTSRKKYVVLATSFIGVGVVANVVAIFRFSERISPEQYLALFHQGRFVSGGVLSAYSESVDALSVLLVGITPVLLLAFWLKWEARRAIVPSWLLWAAAFLSILRPLLRGDRGALLGFIVPLAWLRLFHAYQHGRLTTIRSLLKILAVGGLGVLLFALVAISRQEAAGQLGTGEQAAGYLLGPFNRFGVQMTQGGPLPPSNGLYTLTFLHDFPGLHAVLPLDEFFRELTGGTVPSLQQSFAMWLPYGTDPRFNVISAHGYLFVDFGWFGILFFLLYGFVAQKTYLGAARGRAWGIALSGPLIWTILEWRGKLEITYYNFAAQVVVLAIFLGLIRLLPDAPGGPGDGRVEPDVLDGEHGPRPAALSS